MFPLTEEKKREIAKACFLKINSNPNLYNQSKFGKEDCLDTDCGTAMCIKGWALNLYPQLLKPLYQEFRVDRIKHSQLNHDKGNYSLDYTPDQIKEKYPEDFSKNLGVSVQAVMHHNNADKFLPKNIAGHTYDGNRFLMVAELMQMFPEVELSEGLEQNLVAAIIHYEEIGNTRYRSDYKPAIELIGNLAKKYNVNLMLG